MSSSLKLINLAQKATTTAANFKSIGHRATYYSRIIGMTNAQKKQKRPSNIDSFKAYIEQILPDFEEVIEVRLLRERYNALDDPLLKRELLLAYKRRQLTISELRKAREPFRAPQELEVTPFYEPEDVYIRDLYSVTEQDIGRVVEYPLNDVYKYFPLSPLGDYYHNQLKTSNKFCLQCTEEAFKLTNEMRKLNAERLGESAYQKIFAEAESTKDSRQLLNDEELYPRIFHDFALTFLERLAPYRKDAVMNRMFTDCYLFDALVNVLVRELINKELRPHLINQEKRAKIIDQVLVQVQEKLGPESNPQRIKETFNTMEDLNIALEENQSYKLVLKKYANNPRTVPATMREFGLKHFIGFNSGAIASGIRGAGKSGLLMYATMWAHKNNWIVVNPPDAYFLTQNRQRLRRHHDSGLYLEFAKAQAFLKAFKTSNYELVKDIPVDMKLYGKYNLAGVHDEEPEPIPVTYDKVRKVWSNDWERFITPNEKLFMSEERRQFNVRLRQKIPEPKTLGEIVDFGIKEEMFSINVIYELLEQLYNLESHRVLVIVDNYNYFYLPTCYPSFRYANQKDFDSKIPAHHLALSRAFMKFDGHKIKNGLKLVAPGFKRMYKHKFTPNQINFGKGYTIELNGLPFDDYILFTEHLKQAGIWQEGQQTNISATEQKFLESQGNFHETLNGIMYSARLYETA
jgi:small subunit ribosomal protein S29